jgi:hypothetical protein
LALKFLRAIIERVFLERIHYRSISGVHMMVFYARTEREGALAIHNDAALWHERSIAWMPFAGLFDDGRPDFEQRRLMHLTRQRRKHLIGHALSENGGLTPNFQPFSSDWQ